VSQLCALWLRSRRAARAEFIHAFASSHTDWLFNDTPLPVPYATKSKIPVEEIVRAQRPPRATSRGQDTPTSSTTIVYCTMP
jgi:hypothetical protein